MTSPELLQRPDMIMTVSGEPVWFLEPERSTIHWEDVSLYLTNLNRYNGGCRWSLAKHLVLCVRMVDLYWPGEETPDKAQYKAKLRRWLAAHDIHEIYVGDMVSGLKMHMPEFKAVEKTWEQKVHAWLGLEMPTDYDKLYVDTIDKDAVVLETWLHAPPVYRYFVTSNPAREISEQGKALVTEVQGMSETAAVEFIAAILGVNEEKYE